MNVTLCVPVLNRYDLLREMLLSLRESDLQPDLVQVIDNGQNEQAVKG